MCIIYCASSVDMVEEEQSPALHEVGVFLSEYATHLMSCGVHSSRVIRNTKRIGISLGCEVKISIFQKSLIISVLDLRSREHYNEVCEIYPYPISFEHNARLSALSWETYDHHLSFAEIKERYELIIKAPMIHPLFVLLLVGFANASFCRLFGGDWASMGIVFSSTLCGMLVKQQMSQRGVNHYLTFIVSAFVASLCASTSVIFDITSEIAIATSVLYLVPGVPLINGVIDIVEGHVAIGLSRLVSAWLLIGSIAIGLSFTILIMKDNLL